MAKKAAKGEVYPYPSRFGSHRSMVNEKGSISADFNNNVICTDEYGDYLTTIDRLDNGMSDPNRCAESRLSKLFSRSQKEEKK